MENKRNFTEPLSRREFLSVAGIGIIAVSWFPKIALAAENEVIAIRTGIQPGKKTRLVIETKMRPSYSLSYPDGQLVVTIKARCPAKPEMVDGTLINTIDVQNGKIVANLKKSIAPASVLLLEPTGSNKYRLVLDFAAGSSKTQKKDSEPVAQKKTNSYKPTIVIDPGHGGKDPGCIGITGAKEKDIVLSVAKNLYDRLDNLGYKVYLTRVKDKFLNLDTRAGIAQKKKADLFISIHANSNPKKSIKGFSVYTLSKTASDAEAQKLADAENAADQIEVDGFEKFEPEIRNALSALQQHIVAEKSVEFAQKIINATKSADITRVDKARRFAPFAVLKSTIPSCLVELGHLSNKSEEAMLRDRSYQNKLVVALTTAIGKYEFDV